MQTEHVLLPAGSPGTQSTLTTWRYGHSGGKKMYIQAGIHADEWPGLLMLHHLHKRLEHAKINGEILIVPYANPVGMRQFLGGYQLGRFDFDYSGNFNRGFLNLAEAAQQYLNPQQLGTRDTEAQIRTIRQAMGKTLDAWQPQLESEHLRKALQQLSYDADYVIDVHCDAMACAHAFVNQRHQQTGEALAQAMELSALILEDDPGAMAFDEASASPWWRLERLLGISLPYATFSATLELRGERDINDKLAAQDAANFMRFLAHVGLVEGERLELSRTIGSPLSGVARVLAPHTGLIDFKVTPGVEVKEGDLVAEIIHLEDPTAKRTKLYAPAEGIVYALGRNHMVRCGHVVIQIAGKLPLGNVALAY